MTIYFTATFDATLFDRNNLNYVFFIRIQRMLMASF